MRKVEEMLFEGKATAKRLEYFCKSVVPFDSTLMPLFFLFAVSCAAGGFASGAGFVAERHLTFIV